MADASHFIETTEGYWQRLEDAVPPDRLVPPFRYGYPACLPDGRVLMLPIRRRAETPERAVASLIPNHASFAVIDALAGMMAAAAQDLDADSVVGLPSLGLALAPLMAQKLGHPNYVPLGYSRKYWYQDRLSEAVSSFTSPEPGKRVYLDPHLLPRVEGRRIVLVDDTISTGRTALAALTLFGRLDTTVAGLVFAMAQGDHWQAFLPDPWPSRVRFVFRSPILRRVERGWTPCDPA